MAKHNFYCWQLFDEKFLLHGSDTLLLPCPGNHWLFLVFCPCHLPVSVTSAFLTGPFIFLPFFLPKSFSICSEGSLLCLNSQAISQFSDKKKKKPPISYTWFPYHLKRILHLPTCIHMCCGTCVELRTWESVLSFFLVSETVLILLRCELQASWPNSFPVILVFLPPISP